MNICDLFTASTNTISFWSHCTFLHVGELFALENIQYSSRRKDISGWQYRGKVNVGWTTPPGFVRWGVSFVLNWPPTSYWHNWTGLTTSWPLSIHQAPEGLTQISPDTERYVCHMRNCVSQGFLMDLKNKSVPFTRSHHLKPKGHATDRTTEYCR